MTSVNQVTLIGNVGSAPEVLKKTEKGTFIRFSIALNRQFTRQGQTVQKTQWHKVVANNGLGTFIAAHLKKGMRVFVSGELNRDKWTDKNGVVHFSDRRPENLDNLKGQVEQRDLTTAVPGDSRLDFPEKKTAPVTAPVNPVAQAMNATFTIKGTENLGTGFFISSTGYAVTCRHVVEMGSGYSAILNDQSELPLQIVSMSDKYDLALIMVVNYQTITRLTPRDSDSITPGERLFAIGSSAGLQSTVTDGVYTGFRSLRSTDEKVIQFSAPINQGNSGGPLIDEKGQFVGVVSWKYMSRGGYPYPVWVLRCRPPISSRNTGPTSNKSEIPSGVLHAGRMPLVMYWGGDFLLYGLIDLIHSIHLFTVYPFIKHLLSGFWFRYQSGYHIFNEGFCAFRIQHHITQTPSINLQDFIHAKGLCIAIHESGHRHLSLKNVSPR